MNTATDAAAERPQAERMHCMEVWGGNQQANKYLELAGLEAWVFSQPHGEAEGGGDIYYLSSCASGRITRLLVADVSGHGEEAAGLAVALRDLMRRNVNFISQNRLVRGMNRQFGRLPENTRFATALVCSYYCPTRTLTLSNAGHPEPLFYSQETRLWSVIDSAVATKEAISDTPLGVIDHAQYTRTQISLSEGDLVLCFTDALPESLGGDNRQLGKAGVLEIAQSLDVTDPQRIIPELLQGISSQNKDNFLNDDTTVLLLRANSSGPSLKDNLLAPLRLLRPVRDHTKLLPSRTARGENQSADE